MKTENFSCDASNGQVWTCDGLFRVIRFESGSALGFSPKIRVRSIVGAAYDCELVPGRSVKVPEAARGIIVTNISGAASLTGKITIGAGDITDNSIVGEVSIIDGEKARSLAGALFVGMPSIGAVAAQYPIAQLWNPAGTGKNLIVTQTVAGSNAAGAVLFSFGAAARTTNLTATHARNKLSGAAIGVAQVRVENNVASPASQFWSGYVAANGSITWGQKGPLVIPPGTGLDVWQNTVNTSIVASLEWYEDNV